jgi:hypothetical protein
MIGPKKTASLSGRRGDTSVQLFYSLDTTSSDVVASLPSIPATVASYSLPKLAKSASILIESFGLESSSILPISLCRYVSFDAPQMRGALTHLDRALIVFCQR